MFLTKLISLALVCLVEMLLLAQFVPAISASHILSSCFLVNKGNPVNSTIQVDTLDIVGVVYNAPHSGSAFQSWWLRGFDGTFSITNMATGRVLDSNEKGDVFTLDYYGGPSQKWRWNGDCLQNVATGLYLTIEGAVRTRPYTGRVDQQWERRHETKF